MSTSVTSDVGPRPVSMLPTPSTEKPTKAKRMAQTLGRLEPNIFKNGASKSKQNGTEDGARFDARFKIVMLGESGVGKTSLIRAAVGEPFNPTMISTIGKLLSWDLTTLLLLGIDFVAQNYNVDNYRIQLQIW